MSMCVCVIVIEIFVDQQYSFECAAGDYTTIVLQISNDYVCVNLNILTSNLPMHISP